MAIGYAEALRNARMDEVTARAGNGALLRIYDGSRPATGGAATTKLSEHVCGSPFAAAASEGVLTANAIADDEDAVGGTATWFRIVQSDGSTHVLDGSVGTSGSGADLILSTTAITTGATVEITSLTITEGNA